VNEGLYVLGVNDVVRVSRTSATIHEHCPGQQEEYNEVPPGTIRVQWGLECNIAFPDFNVQGVKVVESSITAPKWKGIELQTDFNEQLININNIPDVVEIKVIPALVTPPNVRWSQNVGEVSMWVWLTMISVLLIVIVAYLYKIRNRQSLPICQYIPSDDNSDSQGAVTSLVFKQIPLVEYPEVPGTIGVATDDEEL
jgi:hypothetical protein